jgi:hypothetical protein
MYEHTRNLAKLALDHLAPFGDLLVSHFGLEVEEDCDILLDFVK